MEIKWDYDWEETDEVLLSIGDKVKINPKSTYKHYFNNMIGEIMTIYKYTHTPEIYGVKWNLTFQEVIPIGCRYRLQYGDDDEKTKLFYFKESNLIKI